MRALPFTRRHLRSALVVLGIFVLLNAWIAWRFRASYEPKESLLWMIVAVPLGPLTGAVVRGWPFDASDQSCIDNAFHLLPWHGLWLGLAVIFQWFGSARPPGRIRMTLWVLGWIGWYAGGIVALGHSLE